MADMDFWACSYSLCTILKKEVRKAVETGIQKILIMARWILEPVVKPFSHLEGSKCIIGIFVA